MNLFGKEKLYFSGKTWRHADRKDGEVQRTVNSGMECGSSVIPVKILYTKKK